MPRRLQIGDTAEYNSALRPHATAGGHESLQLPRRAVSGPTRQLGSFAVSQALNIRDQTRERLIERFAGFVAGERVRLVEGQREGSVHDARLIRTVAGFYR